MRAEQMVIARLKQEALANGIAREGAVRCERGRNRVIWSINGNRSNQTDCERRIRWGT